MWKFFKREEYFFKALYAWELPTSLVWFAICREPLWGLSLSIQFWVGGFPNNHLGMLDKIGVIPCNCVVDSNTHQYMSPQCLGSVLAWYFGGGSHSDGKVSSQFVFPRVISILWDSFFMMDYRILGSFGPFMDFSGSFWGWSYHLLIWIFQDILYTFWFDSLFFHEFSGYYITYILFNIPNKYSGSVNFYNLYYWESYFWIKAPYCFQVHTSLWVLHYCLF